MNVCVAVRSCDSFENTLNQLRLKADVEVVEANGDPIPEGCLLLVRRNACFTELSWTLMKGEHTTVRIDDSAPGVGAQKILDYAKFEEQQGARHDSQHLIEAYS